MSHYTDMLNMTSDRWSGFERVRVDAAQTGFFEGREFRSFYEFDIPVGQSVTARFVAPCPFILFEQVLIVDSGGLRLSAFVGGAESGSFSTALPIVGKNRSPDRRAPYYVPQISIMVGGSVSGGTLTDVTRLIAPGGGSNKSTIQGGESDERGLPAGTYHLRLENLTNEATKGVYSLWWEERARHPDWKVGNTSGG